MCSFFDHVVIRLSSVAIPREVRPRRTRSFMSSDICGAGDKADIRTYLPTAGKIIPQVRVELVTLTFQKTTICQLDPVSTLQTFPHVRIRTHETFAHSGNGPEGCLFFAEKRSSVTFRADYVKNYVGKTLTLFSIIIVG